MANTRSDLPCASTILLALTLIGAGPARAEDTVSNQRGPDGGRVLSLAVDPVTTTTVFAGTRTGGVFKSTDGGTSWRAVNQGLAISLFNDPAVIDSLTIDPTDPSVIYAGSRTGAGGLFKSTDAGESWRPLDLAVVRAPHVRGVWVDPTDGAHLLAIPYFTGDDARLVRSFDGGETWRAADRGLPDLVRALAADPRRPATLYAGLTRGHGVYKSTNGGRSWHPTALDGIDVETLAIDPESPATVYAGTLNDGVFKSTDGGETWRPAGRIVAVNDLAVHPDRPRIVHAATWWGLFRSADGGATWTRRRIEDHPVRRELSYFSAAVHDSRSPDTIYAASVSRGVVKSLDGGRTWARMSRGLAATDLRSLAVDPERPGVLFAGSFGSGAWRTLNGGGAWRPVGDVLGRASFHDVTVDPRRPRTIYMGARGGVARSDDRGRHWRFLRTGVDRNALVTALALDPTLDGVLFAGAHGQGLLRSDDRGESWSVWSEDLLGQYFEGLVVDPFEPSNLYALIIRGEVYSSTDGGRTWTIRNQGPECEQFRALALDPSDPSTLYGATFGRGICKSDDGAISWRRLPAPVTHDGLAVSYEEIALDPADPAVVYAGTLFHGLFRSVDAGGTWENVASGVDLPDVHALAVGADRTVYVGTENGLFSFRD